MLVWLSLDTWLITSLSIIYLLLLFVVAYWGQKNADKNWLNQSWVYGLSIGVSCTSWAFYGTVGQAATTGAWLAPIYIGTILCFVFAWPMFLRILRITKQQNLTSIADFIACRYDRSPLIAATVTLVALLGTIPYIALQLRAISKSFDLLTGSYQSGISTTFVVTVVLMVFSILFGARQVVINKQNQGLVLAIAFSSIIKLFSLTAIGIFATFFVFDGVGDLLAQAKVINDTPKTSSTYFAISQALLGMITVFILPQQFHMLMIENHNEKELRTARWLYPLYLILINLFILPIAIAGQNLFPGGSVDADTYVITIPLFFQQAWLGGLAYIGGLAAATSMVIVATIVLSTMVTTEIVNPLLLRYNSFLSQQKTRLPNVLLNIRRLAIALLLLLAFAFERVLDQQNHLATIGLLSFVLLAQLAPMVIGALYWRTATSNAAFIGLVVGSMIWLYSLLLPTLMPNEPWVVNGPFNLFWLKPDALLGLSIFDNITHGLLISLLANSACYVLISLLTHRSVGEKLQAELFINKQQVSIENNLSNKDLYQLLQRFVNHDTAEQLLQLSTDKKANNQVADNELIDFTRLQLSSILGSASTRMVMKAATKQQTMPLEDVVNIVDEASQLFQFNRELLQAGVENIEQGISVIDADMRLVAWNQRYVTLLNYPADIVKVGTPIADLIRYNTEQGVIVSNHIEGNENNALIERRLAHMRAGNSHYFQREMPSGIVLEIRGQAMPGGGFVSTFSDITEHIKAEKALQLANETLEKRVAERTTELTQAKAEAEAANKSKTRFLAAASHDLMQPFNALSLFTSVLKQKAQGTELAEITNNISDSLVAAEALLSDLVEISKLEGGSQSVNESTFDLDDLLTPLAQEFKVIAKNKGISFSYQTCHCAVESDKNLLRRIVQNYLSNALKYSPKGRVVLGVRRQKNTVKIEVWDNGPGIAQDKQQLIFKEFERLSIDQDKPGLGLGLAICKQISRLINTPISLNSTLNKGSCFQVQVPISVLKETDKIDKIFDDSKTAHIKPAELSNDLIENQVTILVIDNDPLVLKAMVSLLESWRYKVICISDKQAFDRLLFCQSPMLIIADYYLDNQVNGVDLVQGIIKENHWQVNCIINSADPSEAVRQHTSDAQFSFIRKPIKPLALRRLIKQLT
ncbi:MAG: PAS-domain containing protein [Colwellia sp.]|nr:PAS-domain containing protein [Colwellia sp.]